MASSSASTHEEAVDGTEGTPSNLRSFFDSVTPVVKAHTLHMDSYLPLMQARAIASMKREMASSRSSTREEAIDGAARTHSNLRSFLDSVTPVVKAHTLPMDSYLPLSNGYYEKIADGVRGFYLGDLWNSFYEWSACGVGTSVCITPDETVVQYFVPYLSAIQLYTNVTNVPTSQSMLYDGRFKQDTQYGVINWMDTHQAPSHMSTLGVESKGELFFKYFEPDSPYERMPFVDKVYDLCHGCPSLSSLSSTELSPSSWISIFWYPTSHFPVKSQKDLNTCFLTYHSLSTCKDIVALDSVQAFNPMALAPFGLAAYKLDAKVWASPNSGDQEHISSLFDAARSWLKEQNIHHHDFNYFSQRCSSK